MARTERNNQTREKDHSQLEREKAESFRKITESSLKSENFWCHSRENRINLPVCQKIQSTAGCPATQENCPLWDQKLNLKAKTKPGTEKNKSGKLSYQVIMKNHFLKTGKATLEELVNLINNHPSRKNVDRLADNKNVSVGVSILKNTTRTKTPLKIDFSRKTKYYYCLDFKGMKKAIIAEEAIYDSAKKESDKAKTEESTPTPTPAPALDTLTVKDLKALAGDAKVDGYKKMKKAELITALTPTK